jgi:hypothetical protein
VPSARWDAFWTHSSAQLTHSLAIEWVHGSCMVRLQDSRSQI